METNNTEIERLKAILSTPQITEDDFVKTAAAYIDLGNDLGNAAAMNFAIELLTHRPNAINRKENLCLIHYYIGVAYGVIFDQTIAKTEEDWVWEQEIVEKELYNLRLAFENITPQVDPKIAAYILINLANRFDNIGRFLLSHDFWNGATKRYSNLGMAQANMGNSLVYYGRNYLNSVKYQVASFQLAHQFFNIALKKPLFPGVKAKVKVRLEKLETDYRPALDYLLVRHDLLEEYADVDYAGWVTNNGFWLNPLSGVSSKLNCNKDDLVLFHAEQSITDFFNSIKDDFKYCRRLYFDTLEDSSEFSIQRKKTTFKEAYSIFDKVAYLVSAIYNLDNADHPRLSFSRMWYNKLDKNKGLNTVFTGTKNLMLRALFWVSKDIYLNEDGFKNMIEPKAKEVNNIRNYVEHRSFRFGSQRSQNFTLEIPVEEFDESILKLLKLARETLGYAACLTKPTAD